MSGNNPNDPDFDPLDQGGSPALSLKDMPGGTEYKIRATGRSSWIQGRDFDSGDPMFWEGKDGTDGTPAQPVMCAVINGFVLSGPQDVGEERSVWARKPSSMLEALTKAQREHKQKTGNPQFRVDDGVEFTVTLVGTEQNKDKKKADIKKYAVVITGYTAPAAGSAAQQEEPPF